MISIKKTSAEKNDEKSFCDFESRKLPLDLTSFRRLVMNDLCLHTEILDTGKVGVYDVEDIEKALLYPNKCGNVLVDASAFLFRKSPHYKRLNMYIANLALFDWKLDIYDIKSEINIDGLRNNYNALCSQLEKMNIKHELSKIVKVLPYQDIFCGVVCESNDDWFIQKLDLSMCKIQKIQDGIYNFKINLNGINPINIKAYPTYIQEAYVKYCSTPNCNPWYMPPADQQVCFKLHEEVSYPMPLLINIVKDIFDLDTYKKLKMQGARVDNYKALVVTIPLAANEVDKPLLTPPALEEFAYMNRANMTDDIGLIHAPGSAQAVSFKENSNSRNNVEDATTDIYDSSGVSKENFNGSSSGTALTYSVENDSSIIYGLYRQIEVWFNRYIKIKRYNKPKFKFSFSILDSTIYNRDKIIDRYLKLAQSGAPVRRDLMSLLGYSPSRSVGASILENQVLKWHDLWIPLASSYTQSSEIGRPTNESKGAPLDTSGEQTQNNDSNSKR